MNAQLGRRYHRSRRRLYYCVLSGLVTGGVIKKSSAKINTSVVPLSLSLSHSLVQLVYFSPGRLRARFVGGRPTSPL